MYVRLLRTGRCRLCARRLLHAFTGEAVQPLGASSRRSRNLETGLKLTVLLLHGTESLTMQAKGSVACASGTGNF